MEVIPLKQIKRTPIFVSDHAQSMMVALWYASKDTNEIAKLLSLPEYEVANRLPVVREHHRRRSENSPA